MIRLDSLTGEAKVFLDSFKKIEFGNLKLTSPENETFVFKGKKNGPEVHLKISDWMAFNEILNKSDIGLFESYVKNYWSSSSIDNLIEWAIMNENAFKKAFVGNWAKIIFYRLKHEARENSLLGSKENIKAHYDLGNDFYKLWLDETMTYSSAIFKYPNESLESAQKNKYQSMLDLISPKISDHILEVGCGWGGFLEYAASKGFKVTGITISQEQFDFATERIKNKGLEHLARVELCDYRDLKGSYDHAVSVEMIEAVGENYWESYFKMFKSVLKPNGRVAVQAIIIDDKHFAAYRKGTDFIQQYVFPGGMLLSVNAINKQLGKADLKFLNRIHFGHDYAQTLNYWQQEFRKKLTTVKAQGFDDDFIKLWDFYLSYCQGAFRAKRIDVVQFSASV